MLGEDAAVFNAHRHAPYHQRPHDLKQGSVQAKGVVAKSALILKMKVNG
ncbi:MAG: hypothetical protein ACJAZP_002310 [Psychromonas sp.]|jgi:hypothetical protein